MTPTPTEDRSACPAPAPVLELLKRSERVLLCGHVHPDGDCIGAQAALARVLAALGKEVRILNPDPVEACFHYLAREVDYGVHADSRPLPEHDLLVLLDCSELSRLGPLGERLAATSGTRLVLDHHIHRGEEWWTEAWIDRSAAATGLLVERIARALEVPLDPVAAAGVFTSLVTDTGWFKYSNTDAECLTVAGRLIASGVDPSLIYQAIYQRHEPEHPLRIGRLLAGATYLADGRLALLSLPYAPENRHLDGDDALDLMRAVDRVEVVLFLREIEPGVCKLSARSKSDAYDVAALAGRVGGGGHRRAAGATIKGGLAEVRVDVSRLACESFGWAQEDGA